jgi:hypothetical protein
VEGSCEHGNEPSRSIKHWEVLSSCTTGGLSRKTQLLAVSDFPDATATPSVHSMPLI